MNITDEQIRELGERFGFGTRCSDDSFIWFDGDPTDMIRAAVYDAKRKCAESDPASILVHAYAAGAATGASIDWSDVDKAHVAARAQLGPERCAEIESLYAEGDD